MSRSTERLDSFFEKIPTEIFNASYEDQKRAMEADVLEQLNEGVEGGWLTQDEAEEMFENYRATLWGNRAHPKDEER